MFIPKFEKQNNESRELESFHYFPTIIYTAKKPEFLKDAKEACRKAVNKKKKETSLDEIYPVYMTENLFQYEGMDKLNSYIAQTAWDILNEQGYDMNNFQTVFTEFWCQEYQKTADMRQHVHSYDSQIVGFYFVETPKDCSKVIFHDPRPGKVQISLPEANSTNATPASVMINFQPEEGMLIFTNSWLSHSFSRHYSNKPIRFIHFNLTVKEMPQTCLPAPAEVI